MFFLVILQILFIKCLKSVSLNEKKTIKNYKYEKQNFVGNCGNAFCNGNMRKYFCYGYAEGKYAFYRE